MAAAQEEPGLLQRDLLAGRLAGSDFLNRAREISSLVQTDLLASKLVGVDPDPPKAARPISEVLCEIAKCQLCEIARRAPDSQLCNTARPELNFTKARSEPINFQPCDIAGSKLDLTKARPELCDTVTATRRVNAPSPLVDSKGQRVLRSFAGDFTARKQDAVGLRTPVATI
jgi:hypothetical protein